MKGLLSGYVYGCSAVSSDFQDRYSNAFFENVSDIDIESIDFESHNFIAVVKFSDNTSKRCSIDYELDSEFIVSDLSISYID